MVSGAPLWALEFVVLCGQSVCHPGGFPTGCQRAGLASWCWVVQRAAGPLGPQVEGGITLCWSEGWLHWLSLQEACPGREDPVWWRGKSLKNHGKNKVWQSDHQQYFTYFTGSPPRSCAVSHHHSRLRHQKGHPSADWLQWGPGKKTKTDNRISETPR